MQPASFRQRVTWRDFFTADFWRFIAKAIWLFFPSIIFLVMAWFSFWKLTQGKDLIQITLEKPDIFAYFIIAQVFWFYVTWYTGRIIGKIKMYQQPDASFIWKRFLTQMPRLLGFSCFSVIILAFLRLRFDPFEKYSFIFYGLLVLSIPGYFLIYYFWSRLADKADDLTTKKNKIRYIDSFRFFTYGILGISLLIIIFTKSFFFLMVLLIGLQVGLVLILVFRRKKIFIEEQSFFEKTDKERGFNKESGFVSKVKGFVFDTEDKLYTNVFIVVIIISFMVYLRTVFSVPFSVTIGSFPFVLLAFGVLLMLGNIVTLLSVMGRFNFHLLLFLLAFTVGLLTEPHYTFLPPKKNEVALFSKRQNLQEFFYNWIEKRKAELDTATGIYPVYLVLSDGGASRSGYWVASVLAKLEDTTNGRFSKHLFCLSGASGGSVGNAAFFNLLQLKQSMGIDSTAAKSPNLDIVQDYLESDFLTFTLARMLGPDVFRHILPFPFIDDRAASLAKALEQAPGKNCLLYDAMATRFSEFITQTKQPYELPILCINTTRMQDGRPGVISNIDLTDATDRYNKRLDVLDLLSEEQDMKLSTAVVLGASFPYVSPAGRIDSKNNIDSTLSSHYFVDGGYFDNSGSGVVSEMINILLRDTVYLKYREKIQFYILQINNEPTNGSMLNKVNPLVNDLAAPVKTLIGAYGSQTTINDERLRNFMKSVYNDNGHYRRINLYDDDMKITYSMNWVISDTLLYAMNRSLGYNKELKRLVSEMTK